MATHLEYVTGPLGERMSLPCACDRERDHARPTSTAAPDARHVGAAGAVAAAGSVRRIRASRRMHLHLGRGLRTA